MILINDEDSGGNIVFSFCILHKFNWKGLRDISMWWFSE